MRRAHARINATESFPKPSLLIRWIPVAYYYHEVAFPSETFYVLTPANHPQMGSCPDPESQLPWWQVNISPEKREIACPEPLRNLGAKDREIIGTWDEDYRPQTWDEVVDIIRTDRLGDFRRWPSDLRRYREYIWWLNREYGSVMRFMLQERLHWAEPIESRGSRLFECKDDFRILMNDWPYGLDERIVHLVVWTKFELEDNAETEAEIDRFVAKTFSSGVAKDKVSE